MIRFTRILPLLAVLGTVGASNSAFAGYTALGSASSGYSDTTGNGLSVGDKFALMNVALNFVGETANDPTSTATSFTNYRLNIDSTIDSAPSGFGAATANGTYVIYYDQNANGLFDENLIVSSGTASFSAFFTLSGTLTPTAGPNNSQSGDIDTRYSFAPSSFSMGGFTSGNAFDQGGSVILRQTAIASNPVPEPASLAALGLGGLALLRRRRARK